MASGINPSSGRSPHILDPVIRSKASGSKATEKPFALPDTKINQASKSAPVEKTNSTNTPTKTPELKSTSMPTRPVDKSDIVNMLVAFQKSPVRSSHPSLAAQTTHSRFSGADGISAVALLLCA